MTQSRTDVVQLGQEVTFILQETHKRFANLNQTECLYVSSFLIHQLPDQTELLSQHRLSVASPHSSTSPRQATQPGALPRGSALGLHQNNSAAGRGASHSNNHHTDAVLVGTPAESTLASTATTASTIATPTSDDLDAFDDHADDGAGEPHHANGGPYSSTDRSVLSRADDTAAAVPLSLNLANVLNRRASRESELEGTLQGSLNLWQQSVVLILQDATRAFRRYEEEEEDDDGTYGYGVRRRAPHDVVYGVRPTLQRALEEAADRWAHGSGSQWQTPRAGVATTAAVAIADTPRSGHPRPANNNNNNKRSAVSVKKTADMLMAMRSAEQQARALCRQAYENLYDRIVAEGRQLQTPPARQRGGFAAPEPPACSVVIECDAPENVAGSAGSSPRSPGEDRSSSRHHVDGSPSRSEGDATLLAFVVGCDLAQLEYLQQTVMACTCDPYPGSDLSNSEQDAMNEAEQDTLAERQNAWRQRHCLIRILEPSTSVQDSAATSVTDGGDTQTEPTGAPYTLSEGVFALRSLLGLAFEVLGEVDPHLVALVDDPERSLKPSYVVASAVFWSAWPNSVPLRPRRGEQRASLRGGPHLPLPRLPAEMIIEDKNEDDYDDDATEDDVFDNDQERDLA